MAKTAVITGATGFLGRQILKAFESEGWHAVGLGFTRANPPSIMKVDLSTEADVASMLDQVKPDVIIHSAANRFPDKCDADPEGARKTNVEASRSLAEQVVKRRVLIIYISTDYVFPGRPGEAPYEADARPEPTNVYGQSKLDGEKAVLEVTEASGLGVVLRVPVLYGPALEPSESAVNVLMDKVWKAADKDADIKMDDWAQRYPTNTQDVARVCFDIATKYVEETQTSHTLPRILQFSSEDRFTKYELCQLFATIMGLPLDGMKPERAGNDPNAKVQRPYDTHLSTKALQDIGINVRTQGFEAWWRWQVKAYRK